MATVILTDMRPMYLNTMAEIKLVRIDFLEKVSSVKLNRRDGSGSFTLHSWGSVMLWTPPGMGTAFMPIQQDGKWTSMKVDLNNLLIDCREDRGGSKAIGNGYMILPIVSFDSELPKVTLPKYKDKVTGELKNGVWITNKMNRPVMDEIAQAVTDLVRAKLGYYVVPTGPDIGLYNGRPMASGCATCKHLVNFHTFAEDGDQDYPFLMANPGLPTKKDDRTEMYMNTFCGMHLETTMEEAFEIWNGCQELDKYPVRVEKKDGTFFFAHAGFGTKKILFGNRLMDWSEVKETIGKGDVCGHFRYSGLKANGIWAKTPAAVTKIYTITAKNDFRPGFPEVENEIVVANTGTGVWVTVHPAYTKDYIGAQVHACEPKIREYNVPVVTSNEYELWKEVILKAAVDNAEGFDPEMDRFAVKSEIMIYLLDDLLLPPRIMQNALLREAMEFLGLDPETESEYVEVLDLMYSEQPRL